MDKHGDLPAQPAPLQDANAARLDEPASRSTIDWLRVNDDAIDRIHAQLAHLGKIGLGIKRFVADWETPTPAQLRNLIEVAFWASLRSNEGRSTRVRLAVASRTMIPEANSLATPVEYDDSQVAKLAHVVPAEGCLAVSESEGALRIWGIARSRPPSWIDAIAVEISAPGIIRLNLGPLQPFAVFCGRSVSILEGTRIRFASYLQGVLRKQLPVTDFLETQAVWRECLVLAHLARLILDEGHGGTLLIVPAEEGEWLDSLDPFAFRFARSDNTIRDWIRRDLTDGTIRAETSLRVSGSNLTDGDKNIVLGALSHDSWDTRDILRPVASLAGCDGAVVMTRDLQVLGFGAKIRPRSAATIRVCMFRPDPGPQQVASSALEDLGGTRHQSAARFVSVHKDAVAIVVSHDRHMSVAHWDQSHESVFVVRNADWWV